MDNIDVFNRIVATLLKELYSKFPEPVDISVSEIRDAAAIPDEKWFESRGNGPNPVSCTMEWLSEENYIRYADSAANTVFASVILTSKGFAALNKSPESLSTKPTIGQRLKELSRTASTETVASIVKIALANQLGASG